MERHRGRHLALSVLLSLCGCGASADQRQEEALLGAYGREDYYKVSKAQLILMYSGLKVGSVDGLMGPNTREGVRVFQGRRGLRPTGYIGNATWSEMMTLDKQEGPFVVERLQRRLKRAGFDPGGIDGEVGAETRAALSGFQRANGLKDTGRLDPDTWAALKG
jgi:peptidoglycan hydrolase-like protein with peptidoglycan-binding domain